MAWDPDVIFVVFGSAKALLHGDPRPGVGDAQGGKKRQGFLDAGGHS